MRVGSIESPELSRYTVLVKMTAVVAVEATNEDDAIDQAISETVWSRKFPIETEILEVEEL